MLIKPHAFVAMPFGAKPGPDGQLIDFNRVYSEYIKPALEAARLEPLRADQETRAGDIRTDMFQELLLADLVVADLTIANPNVWYELGVRHALRARGVVIVCGGQVTTAFDLYTDRKLRYGIKDGGPDPETVESDKLQLTAMVKATMESWHGRKVSPVYQLLPNLQEPDWKSLRIGDVRAFWERHDAWEDRIELARKARHVGDILVLADEAPVAAFRAEAWIRAGQTLRKAERFIFALEQLDSGLEVDPVNLKGLREKGICLQRLACAGSPGHSLDRARQHYRNVLQVYPGDPETWALLGRVDKDAWIAAWRRPGSTPDQMKDDAAYEDALLRAAIDSYAKGFRSSPAHYYSGINALTLMHLYRHLTNDRRYDTEMASMAGAVRFAAECESDEQQLFWSKATLGDLQVLVGTPETVKPAYKDAIAKNDKDWFALNSSLAQLQMLKDLGFKPENVDAGIAAFDRALQRLTRPENQWQPRQVILFSGHMIDTPDRKTPRFPAEKEPVAARKIAEALDQVGAGPDDLALTQGACGGDLLFTEACQQRGVKVHWLQPFREPDFIQNSVVRSGEAWRSRYLDAKAKIAAPIRSAPDELGGPPPNSHPDYPYERCNLWLLYTALAYGVDKVRFICLWNGEEGDGGRGGTAHMYNEVKRRTGSVTWIDTRTIW
ncbi:MAG: TRAFs-binding domain-containing protein [Chloroflexota bacterium]